MQLEYNAVHTLDGTLYFHHERSNKYFLYESNTFQYNCQYCFIIARVSVKTPDMLVYIWENTHA